MTLWMEIGMGAGIKEDCRVGAESIYMKCEPDINNRHTDSGRYEV